MNNIESRIDPVKGLRTHTIPGAINLADIKTFLEGLYHSGEFDPKLHALWDVRATVFPEVTPDEIKDLAYFVRAHWAEHHSRKAALVVSSDFHFGLSRMFEQFVSPSAHGKIKAFRDLQSAVDWIAGKATVAPHPANG